MVIEFLGSQTLEDFHQAIVELYEDDLWHRRRRKATRDDNDEPQEPVSTGNECHRSEEEDLSPSTSSGFFFMEGTFFTHGPVNYVSTIQQWLRAGKNAEKKRRAAHLGLPASMLDNDNSPLVKAMADVRLEDLSVRLGVRYIHVHHGDVECSVFVVDRRLGPRQPKVPYPLLHDIWTNDYPEPDCEACAESPAVIATSTLCELTDGGPRFLCEACARQLQLQSKCPNDIELYSVWKSGPGGQHED